MKLRLRRVADQNCINPIEVESIVVKGGTTLSGL